VEAGLVGVSEAMARVRRQIERLADLPSPVLVLGETGTGKGVVARVLHAAGARRARPFVHVDCAGLPESLFESELFGHERGAFTGALAARVGRAEAAADGTLFLDEIGELPPRLQSKLLRLLQERCFERVGGGAVRAFRARVVAATHADLEAAVAQGAFRRDLWFRIDVARITLPPLRERREDLPALVHVLLARAAERLGLPPRAADDELLARLPRHDWPGNVRELENVLERWLIGETGVGFEEAEAERIARVLATSGGNVARAARRLGLARSTLRGRIARHALEPHIPHD
jgi:two-component system response regulator HydG